MCYDAVLFRLEWEGIARDETLAVGEVGCEYMRRRLLGDREHCNLAHQRQSSPPKNATRTRAQRMGRRRGRDRQSKVKGCAAAKRPMCIR